jgi:hypothetical protein
MIVPNLFKDVGNFVFNWLRLPGFNDGESTGYIQLIIAGSNPNEASQQGDSSILKQAGAAADK